MKTIITPLLLLALMQTTRADAQAANSAIATTGGSQLILTNTQPFSFTTDNLAAQSKQQSYCLQDPKKLVKVLSVTAQTSNAASVVNVKGDPDSNCINLSVELPPAKQICTEAPAPTLSAPEDRRQFCTVIPTTLEFTVSYQSRVDVGKVLGDTIYQIENLMASASSGCSGGAHGVPPVNWSSLQSRGNAALIALGAAKTAWAGGQTPNAVQQINSAQGELDALVNGLPMSCYGGAHGSDPFSYSAYVATRASIKGKLDVVKLLLGN